MKAAVVRSFDTSPRFEDYPEPVVDAASELVDVVAAGLHPRVRSQANGSHYTSSDALPLIPGIDGVGRRSDGTLVYFVLPDTQLGSMAERTLIDPRRSIPLAEGADAVQLAAAMNPGMSSWVALQSRVQLQPGQSVLVLGATGSAGQLALQIARRLGAGEVIAAGRGADRLEGLGADAVIDLENPDYDRGANADVVLDYLWGAPAETAMLPLLMARKDRSRLLSWIQIGAVAGPDLTLPSALLRQANLRLLGSGQGSVSTRGILELLPGLAAEIERGTFRIDAVSHPLSEAEHQWTASTRFTERVVLVP